MSCNNCVSIGKKHLGGFKSPSKYALSQKACDALVISNIWVEEPSSNQFDRRFKCKCCGDQWRLEWPDPPISGGLWQKTFSATENCRTFPKTSETNQVLQCLKNW